MNHANQMKADADTMHPAAERLRAFVLGELNDAASEGIEQHLSGCAICRESLHGGAEDSLVALIRAAASTTVGLGLSAPRSAGRRQPHLPGYELLEVLGEGGMGVVWKARQMRLNRLVALKLLRSAGMASAESLARFRREAEAVARLRHANIVQIYEVGEHDGEPYLALEFAGGGNLAQKLADGPLPPSQAAELVETLARAMHHVHQHGILHRDLKPGNVLLDETGAAKIGDFGLAKQLDEATAHTQTGAILGTPSYMAPEQTGGEKATVGPPTDVYALGAILYETLTGRPPFRGPTALDTLAQVREREPVPPRQLQPSVPRDLETICLKCLHKEPRKRYASAADLADDLRRFREGRPIRARRAGLLERLVKWARRQPAWTALGVVSALALAALLGGGLWYQARLRAAVGQADSNRERADANRERADANYRHARQAINQMLDRLAKFRVPGAPQVGVLRRELSKDALTFFQGIAEAEADADPAARFDIAKAYTLLGAILDAQSQSETGRESLNHARLLLEQLCAEDPANWDYRIELSLCLARLAACEAERGRLPECLRFHEQSLEVCRELCRLEPDNADCQRALARGHLNLGCSCNDSDRREQAEFHWKETIRIMEKLVREHPEVLDDQYMLAVGSSNLAMLYRDAGRTAEADAIYREVEPRLTKLVEENAGHRNWGNWAWGLMMTLRNWGSMLVTARRGDEAGPLLNRAIAFMDKWCLEDPQLPGRQALLLGCLVARMCNSTLLHRRDEGDKDWQRAVALSAQLNSWSDLCIGALCDARFGDHMLAAARAEHLAKQKNLRDEDLNQLARAYALAAIAARKDSRLAPTEQMRKADCYAAESIALLSKLRGNGYFDKSDRLKAQHADTDLDSLRQRDDFVKLVNDIAKPAARK